MKNIRVTVGVDGSDTSRAARRWAYDEAASHGAALTVVTAWQPPPLPQIPPYGALPPPITLTSHGKTLWPCWMG